MSGAMFVLRRENLASIVEQTKPLAKKKKKKKSILCHVRLRVAHSITFLSISYLPNQEGLNGVNR